MIKIEKPTKVPKRLTSKGKIEIKKLKKLFDKKRTAYQNGSEKFSFNKTIYGHATVKNALRKAQFDKCCFCERRTEIGDVEHFRGKGGYQQKEGDKLGKPGYYWLAYDWDNLLFACEKCNRSFKKNYFPLSNPKQRAKSHHDNLSLEKPLFIHPVNEAPENYIEFIADAPRAIDGNKKGKITIERIGLDRPFLNEERFAHYQIYKEIYELSQNEKLPIVKRKKLYKIIDDASQNKAPYASMIRSAIKQNFRF